MQYLLLFLEGIITFISPCLLPMLPIYLSYFAANEELESTSNTKTLRNAFGFTLGFTLVFVSLGAFAGTLGGLFLKYTVLFHFLTGLIVILFGLNFLGILRLTHLGHSKRGAPRTQKLGFLSSIVFGLVFSIGWTPCVGAFLGSALMLASQQGSALQGTLMLLAFSFGLGIPFIISAALIHRLQGTFDFIKRNYKIINAVSGGLLIVVGILMMTGQMGYFLSRLTF